MPKSSTLIFRAFTVAATLLSTLCLHAQDNPDWPKGIDPSTLLLNTQPEPDLTAAGFKSLFNGNDLSGWTVKGSQMQFKVENGEIVGTCTPGLKPNSFLCTDETFDNFIFTAEFKWDVIGNSGIMFRADTEQPDPNGAAPVFGYQSEMDPSDRGWTGGIYGERMGDWKYPLSRDEHDAAHSAIEDYHAWNRMTIFANANEIRTWINGVPVAFLIDNDRAKGFFGLQVHSGDKGTVRWRNIKMKPLAAQSAWTDLFENGDFSQWTGLGGKPVSSGWTIENGVVERGGLKPGPIVTKQQLRDFELLFDWKISEAGNSGVKYRTRDQLGLEYQVLDDANHRDGKIVTHRSADIYDLKAAPDSKPINPVGDWNNARIVAHDNHIAHYLNGAKVVEIDLGSEEWKTVFSKSKYSEHEGFGNWTGPILLQDHNDLVWYRNLRLREL